jgi:Putative Actinobacterial Holin-X, holin superfamily III
MLVHLLNALAGVPLWTCYGIVGGLLVISGGVLLLVGKNTIARIDVVPPPMVQTMRENIQWIKERATFDRTSKTHVPR